MIFNAEGRENGLHTRQFGFRNKPDATSCTRILIVDDTRAIHEDFHKILVTGEAGKLGETERALFGDSSPQQHGKNFSVDSAFQGKEALARVQKAMQEGRRYAMAFIDVRMPPGWDGIETTQKIWEIDPDMQVVICTAYSDYSWDEMISKIGNSDRLVILKKPFDMVEVLQLANAMTEKWSLLQQTRQKMGELEELVAERTEHLEKANENLEAEIIQRKRREQCLMLQQDVTRILADVAATSEEVTPKILQIICEGMQWDVGELWTVDRQSKVLHAASIWHRAGGHFAEFKASAEKMVFAQGVGVVGGVWEKGEPVWIADGVRDTLPQRSEAAKKAGLRSGFAFPIRLHGEMLGVINFLGARICEPDDEILQLFATLGNLIGQTLERKKLEEQLRHSQKMDSIGYLAGGVAHDFNNILTVILGYAQVVGLRENLDAEIADGLGQITRAAQRAGNLTAQLLTFSRKQVMQLRELDLNKAIANLAKMLRRVIGEDILLHLEYCGESAWANADEDMIGQILMNLAVNARDAMPKGGTLEITTQMTSLSGSNPLRHGEARTGEFICLTVSDNGCGMAPEVVSRVFEPFFTTKAVGQGTGLGLSTVYGIVKQHQGWIEVTSQPDAGTLFKIFLPRVPGPKSSMANSTESKPPGGKETILLVEDESAVRQLARMILVKHGYRVLEAPSGMQALSIWKEHAAEIDLLLTDIVMPEGMTGRELAQKVRADRPNLKTLFTSGYDPDRAGMEAELGDEVNFLAKPYSPEKLLRAVRQGLDFDLTKA